MRKLLLLAGFVVFSVGFGGVAWAQKSEDTLRWASHAPITAVDPYYNAHREAMLINGQLVWDTLTYRDPDSGEYVPLLAKSWRWIDDVTLDLVLRDDVKWHDGLPFTADDVVYTINYVSNPANKIHVQSNVNWMKSATKTGPHAVRLHLKAPFPAAFEYLSSMIAILPKDFFGPDGVAGGHGRLVGTGPYRLVNFTPGSSIDVERFDGYFAGSPKGRPAIKRIRFRSIPDNSTQIAELLRGGVDWIWYVPSDQAPRLAAIKKLRVLASETMRIAFLNMNVRDMTVANPLKDRRVRQAIAHAIDREKIVKSLVGEGSVLVKSACYRSQFGCRQDVGQYAYDPARAKKLLADAGYPSGTTLELVSSQARYREWSDVVAAQLAAVGIKTNSTVLQYQGARERVVKNTAHLFLGSWGSYSVHDVSAILNYLFMLAPDDMAQDKELAGWLKAASSTVDQKARRENYDKALAKIADEAYVLPLWVMPSVYAHAADLDFRSFPDENPRFFLSKWK